MDDSEPPSGPATTQGEEHPDPREWADGIFRTMPYKDLPAVRDAQREHAAALEGKAREVEAAAEWITSIGRAAEAVLNGPNRDDRAVYVELGEGAVYRNEDDPYLRYLGGVGDEPEWSAMEREGRGKGP